MNILDSLSSNNGHKRSYTFGEECLILKLRSDGYKRNEIADVVGRSPASITAKLGQFKQIAKGCSSTEDFLKKFYEARGEQYVSVEDFNQTVEDYQDASSAA